MSMTLKRLTSPIRAMGSMARFMSSKPVNYELNNKVAVVTASTDGIGLSIAKRLAQSGAHVVISSRKQANVDRTVEEFHKQGFTSTVGRVCHVGKEEDRQALLKLAEDKFGGIDILVSNAATNPAIGHILDTEESVFDKIFEINVKAAFMLSKEVFPYLEKRNGGSIVYISSIAGYNVMPVLSTYSVSKTALLGLTKAVAAQCAASNIRVNCVCPGVIKTSFSKAMWDLPQFTEEFEKTVMIKRMGEPDEIGNLVAFLVSDEASYITSESFVAAGGYFSRL